MQPLRKRIVHLLQLNPDSFGFRLYKIIATFLFVDFTWIFFRANRLKAAVSIIKSVFTANNPWILFDGSLYTLGLDDKNFRLMIYCIIILIIVDICKRYSIAIRKAVCRQDYIFRWLFISLSITGILVFGKYGPAYDAANFIYFQF